jgi:hypothetical protein
MRLTNVLLRTKMQSLLLDGVTGDERLIQFVNMAARYLEPLWLLRQVFVRVVGEPVKIIRG